MNTRNNTTSNRLNAGNDLETMRTLARQKSSSHMQRMDNIDEDDDVSPLATVIRTSPFGPMINKPVSVVNNFRRMSLAVSDFKRDSLKPTQTTVKNRLPTRDAIQQEKQLIRDGHVQPFGPMLKKPQRKANNELGKMKALAEAKVNNVQARLEDVEKPKQTAKPVFAGLDSGNFWEVCAGPGMSGAGATTFAPLINKPVHVVKNKRRVSIEIERFNTVKLKRIKMVTKNTLPTKALIELEREKELSGHVPSEPPVKATEHQRFSKHALPKTKEEREREKNLKVLGKLKPVDSGENMDKLTTKESLERQSTMNTKLKSTGIDLQTDKNGVDDDGEEGENEENEENREEGENDAGTNNGGDAEIYDSSYGTCGNDGEIYDDSGDLGQIELTEEPDAATSKKENNSKSKAKGEKSKGKKSGNAKSDGCKCTIV